MQGAGKFGLNGLGVTMVAAGAYLAYAGIRNVPLLDGLRELAGGRLPAPRPSGRTLVTFTSVDKLNPPGSDGSTDQLSSTDKLTTLSGDAAVKKYNLGPVTATLANAVADIAPRFGLKTVGGWRKFDQFPDHPTGHAADFMIDNMPNGHALGDSIAAYIISNAARLRVDYIIWNRRSWNPRRGTWAAYTGTNPHIDHVHLTVL